jgi:molybdenum cofactor biosynthesis enzyme MoaA
MLKVLLMKLNVVLMKKVDEELIIEFVKYFIDLELFDINKQLIWSEENLKPCTQTRQT